LRLPYSPLHLLVFIAILVLLVAIIQIGAISIAFEKLGLTPFQAFVLLFASLFGSAVNLPLFVMRCDPCSRPEDIPLALRGLIRIPERPYKDKTLVAVNVGGCVIPIFFSATLLSHYPMPLVPVLAGVAVVATVSRFASRPVRGLGIGMPIFVAPLTAAIVALSIGGEFSAPLAYISGTMGVLIGADVLRLADIRKMGPPIASIGGAGTFDGIFLTGILAVLLA
jgi:uncharacterized membrane protein